MLSRIWAAPILVYVVFQSLDGMPPRFRPFGIAMRVPGTYRVGGIDGNGHTVCRERHLQSQVKMLRADMQAIQNMRRHIGCPSIG